MRSTILATALIALMPILTLAQPGEMGMGAAPPKPAPEPSAIEQKVIPELKFDNVTLNEAMDYLRDTIPGFNVTVVRMDGADPNYPILPPMKLKDVTLGQFLELLRTSFPGLTIDRIDGGQGPLFAVHVPLPNPAPGAFTGGFAPPGMGVPAMSPAPEPGNIVRVYKLSNIVSTLVTKDVDAKKALADVLSLIQAGLDQVETDNKCVLKVHEPTQTLIFKGNPMQNGIVEQVLSTLQPSAEDRKDALTRELAERDRKLGSIEMRYNNELMQCRQELDKTAARLADAQKELEKTKVENAVLSAKYDQLQAAKGASH